MLNDSVAGLPDHPVIENMMRTGYPYGEPKLYCCPVCGESITGSTRLYKNAFSGTVTGCEMCVTSVEAREEYECY